MLYLHTEFILYGQQYGQLLIELAEMQILKIQEIFLLRRNGAVFTDFELVPQPDKNRQFAVEFTVQSDGQKEKSVLINSRDKIRTFGDINKAIGALRKIFPELDHEQFIKYRLD